MRDIDLELDSQRSSANDFTSKEPMPNIWSVDKADEEDTMPEPPASPQPPVIQPQSSAGQTILDEDDHKPFVGTMDDDELEKPSFLRRLAKRRRNDES